MKHVRHHPVHEFDQLVQQSSRSSDFFKEVRRNTETDIEDRSEWLDKRAMYQRRRLGLEWRNPTLPWPGSSNIVMPLIDKKIDELKPQYINLITAASPPVTVLAADKASQSRTRDTELFFEWLIKFGSPRFVEEGIFCIDDLLEMGRGVMKTLWHYETLASPERVDRRRLPDVLATMKVVKTQRQADDGFARAQEFGLNERYITRSEFRAQRPVFLAAVEQSLRLNLDDAMDMAVAEEVLSWLESGAEKPLMTHKLDVVSSVPRMVSVSPVDLIVPKATTDIQEAEQITHVMRFAGINGFLGSARDRHWNMNAVMEVVRRLTKEKDGKRGGGNAKYSRRDYHEDQGDRQGIHQVEDQLIEVRETCCWFSKSKFGTPRKVVVLHHPDHPDVPLKFYEYHRPSGKWPYHSPTFELAKRGWYDPRGIPELLDDLEEEITFQHRAKLNRMMIANAPSFAYRPSTLNPSGFQWLPGQFYPVRNPMQDFREIQISNLDISFEREEQILRTWAEDRLGSPDFGLTNPMSQTSEPRTATEIQGIQAQARAALSMRGLLFQRSLQEVYQEFFDLWHTYGPEEVYVQVTGGGEPLRLMKEDLQGKFLFQATGTIGETDPVMDAQKAQARISMLAQIAQAGLGGDEIEIDLGSAIEDWLEKDDPRTAKRVIRRRSEEEVQQIREERQRQEELQQNVLANVPQDPESLMEFIQQHQGKLPHGKAQQVKL